MKKKHSIPKLLHSFFFLFITVSAYCQTTSYGLDSTLQREIFEELEKFDSFFLTDISSYWRDDFMINGAGELKGRKSKKIRIFFDQDSTRGYYGLRISKVRYSYLKHKKYHSLINQIKKLNKKDIEDTYIPPLDTTGIIKLAPTDGPTYTLLYKLESMQLQIIQVYWPSFYQIENHIENREWFINIVNDNNKTTYNKGYK